MPAKIYHSEEQIQKVKKLFDKNYGPRKIAKELNITRSQVQEIYKILDIYNIGRKKQRTAYLTTEKFCKMCKQIKSVIKFRKRYKKETDRTSYEVYCIECELSYSKSIEGKVKKKIRCEKRNAKNPGYKLRKNVSWMIWAHLQSKGLGKRGESCMKHLPYSEKELKYHIEAQFESWMNWDNYGVYDPQAWDNNNSLTWTWQLDHIIPQEDLPYSDMNDKNFKKCWSLDNLRPLNAKQNNYDGVNRIRHKK